MFDWNDPTKQFYHNGLDRGVLYKPNAVPVPWLGFTALDETTEGGSTELYYRDGRIYMTNVEPGDFKAQLKALMFPDEFSECIGLPAATEGLYVDNQKPKPFSLSYRTLVGSGAAGDLFGYQIHLVYNCLASIGSKNRRTLGKDATPTEFAFDVVCTPVKLQGYRPTAHYVLDTRGMSPDLVNQLELIIYGSPASSDVIKEPLTNPIEGYSEGRLPTPQELYDIITAAA